MNRRTFIQGAGGLALAILPGYRLQAATTPRVVLVGGGILGASMAYRLARRGARVTLLEKLKAAAGCTSRSFAWINATFGKAPWNYHLLNRLGISAYRALQAELPELPVRWGGTIEWKSDERLAQELRRELREIQDWGYASRAINAEEIRKLEPAIVPGPVSAAAFSEDEGFLDPVAATEMLLREARSAGAEIVFPCEVTGLVVRGGSVRAVKTSGGEVAADVLLVAAGVDTPRIAAMAGIKVPLVDAPGLLVHTRPMPQLVHRVLIGPKGDFVQRPSGSIVISDERTPPADANHEHLKSRPLDFPDEEYRRVHVDRIVSIAVPQLPALEKAEVAALTMGWRPKPRDGYPVVGFARAVPNIYLAVTHSGITLAQVLARLASLEILEGARVEMLEPYRLSRFR